MLFLYLSENKREISSLIYSEKIVKKCLLMSSTVVVIGASRVNETLLLINIRLSGILHIKTIHGRCIRIKNCLNVLSPLTRIRC